MNIDDMDFVYIIKPGDKGNDLKYSLRSIEKWYPNHKVWIAGYKPLNIINVNYLPIEQKGTKWTNSTNNVIEICKCPDISEDFILMNDDFYCIDPTIPLEDIIDCNIGNLDEVVEKYKGQKHVWAKAFEQVNNLLNELNIEKPLYSYEAHLPLKINKKKFLEVISLPEVQKFMKTPKVLHKRTLYKNYDKPEKILTLPSDVKVLETKDISKQRLTVCGWLSTADGLLGNLKFRYLNMLLHKNFPKPCKYEKEEIIKPKSGSKFKWSKFSQ